MLFIIFQFHRRQQILEQTRRKLNLNILRYQINLSYKQKKGGQYQKQIKQKQLKEKTIFQTNDLTNQIIPLQHYQNQLIILNQMEQQSFQDQSLDISTYLQKRKAVMDWLKSYGSGFNMSRISLATAQYYADMYYHNYPYDKKQVKYVLLSLLILSSKYFDYQKLYTKDIAQFCQLDLHKLNQIELQCCQKLDFNFENNNTYAFFIDKAIKIMRQQTGIDLYEENQQVNVKLTMIYKIAEKLFCQFYEWTANEKNIWYIIQSVFENQVTNNQNSLLNLFIKHKAHPIYDLSQFTLQSKIIRATKDFTQDWKKNNEHHTRKIFQDRHRNSRYKSYSQFSIKYTQ